MASRSGIGINQIGGNYSVVGRVRIGWRGRTAKSCWKDRGGRNEGSLARGRPARRRHAYRTGGSLDRRRICLNWNVFSFPLKRDITIVFAHHCKCDGGNKLGGALTKSEEVGPIRGGGAFAESQEVGLHRLLGVVA